MSSILLVTSSPRGETSRSTKVARELADALAAGGKTIIRRDLGANPLPHIDAVFTSAIRKPVESRSEAEAAAAVLSDMLVDELLAADTVVIATGLINFNIYSTLKSWIDHIARSGKTFRYTDNGPEGLATGKKVYLVVASDGIYSQGPAAAMNHAIPYLKTVLAFLGMTDVEVVQVEGLAFGPEAVDKTMADVQERISKLALAA
jgi:Acyl carrier protein phosphodiesterase